jgi:hypothetical protein
VKARLVGRPDDITAVIAALATVAGVVYSGRTHRRRDGSDVAAYLEIRPHTTQPDRRTAP